MLSYDIMLIGANILALDFPVKQITGSKVCFRPVTRQEENAPKSIIYIGCRFSFCLSNGLKHAKATQMNVVAKPLVCSVH